MSLPDRVDADRIAATFDKGVLEVRIPKPEQRKPHRVEIGASTVEGTAQEK
jgi:HSP20 family protein